MIIQSLLDQDFYKFSMAQVVLHHFPDFWVTYRFKCRNEGIRWTDAIVKDIRNELDHFCTLRFTREELDFLRTIRFLKPYFIEFLELYQPFSRYLKIRHESELHIEIEGPWFMTIFFEMPVLSIVNEVYFRHTTDFDSIRGSGEKRLADKVELVAREGFRFSDFGTRRRYSRLWHDHVVETLSAKLHPTVFTGTSNVALASKYALTPIGTMAHEFIQAGQAVDEITLSNSQKYMLQKWVEEYRGDLGIALSDTLGLRKFLKDFDLYFAKLYDGVRHDSGDPFEWAQTMIDHYRFLQIDPKNKKLVFSDGLDFTKAAKLWNRFKDEAHLSFGIGTNLTNDFEGVKPLQIVVKMVTCNGRPVAKLSDEPKKTMCEDQGFLRYLQSVL